MNDCFFCGPTDAILTEEHIWPQWVSRLLQGRHGSDHFRNLLSGPNSTTRNRASHIIDVTSSEVCLDCNTKWLSGIENAIKPLITPMIIGDEAISLTADNQSAIAAWAYKMAMLLEVPAVGNRDPYFTQAERLQFRRTSLSHPYVKVFLARYAFGQHPGFAMDQRHTFTERSTGTARLLKIATMTVGHLAMQLMAVRSTGSGELAPASEMEFEFLGNGEPSRMRMCHQQQPRVALPKQAVAVVQHNRAVQPLPVSKPGRGGTMKPATLVSIGCLATACWVGSVSPAEACSCSPPETLVASDRSFAVFEGTVVDQRITLIPSLRILAPEQDIVVGRVWKGEVTNHVSVIYLERGMCSGAAPVGAMALFFMVQGEGRLAYGLCSSGVPIADAAPALAKLGPPIATFDDDPAPALTGAAALPPWRRLSTYVATAAVYYFNASDYQLQGLQYRPPLHAGPGLLLSVLFVLVVSLITLASRRLRRLSVPLVVTSAMTVGGLLVWVGHDLASRPEIVEVLFYR